MTEHNLFYYSYAPFTNAQLPPLKVAALYFDKLIVRDPVGASWATIGTDHLARKAVKLLRDANILQTVTSAEILAKFAGPRLCVHHGHPRRGMAARLARPQENRKEEWSALRLESMSSAGADQVLRGG